MKRNYTGFSVAFSPQPLTGRWPADRLLFECVCGDREGVVVVVLWGREVRIRVWTWVMQSGFRQRDKDYDGKNISWGSDDSKGEYNRER